LAIKVALKDLTLENPITQTEKPTQGKLKTVSSDPNFSEKKKKLDLKQTSMSPQNLPSTSSHHTPAPNIPEEADEDSEYDYQPSN